FTAASNVPPPLPNSTDTPPLAGYLPVTATARSILLSPLKSPIATDAGFVPAAKLTAAWKVPSPFPNSTETTSENMWATARSGLSSPLKSPTATKEGADPTPELTGDKVNEPSPAPNNTVTLPSPPLGELLELTTARSGLPSLLKSLAATGTGAHPAPTLSPA